MAIWYSFIRSTTKAGYKTSQGRLEPLHGEPVLLNMDRAEAMWPVELHDGTMGVIVLGLSERSFVVEGDFQELSMPARIAPR